MYLFSYEKGFTFNQFPFALLRVEEGKTMHAKGKGEGQMFPMTIQKTNQALGKFDLKWPQLTSYFKLLLLVQLML